MKRFLLFDLDETLMVEEPAAEAAFLATAGLAALRHDLEVERLALGARARARELWYAAPTHGYCKRVGISSWEGLWCRFEGGDPDIRALREWSPTYTYEAWRLALADQGVEDAALARDLAGRFGEERRMRHEVFADAVGALDELGESHSMALLTNGAACLQREKLAASGLGDYFDAVVVSADVGVAKPGAAAFEHALAQLGASSGRAVMVGDSLAKDIEGAHAVGLRGVWVNRDGRPAPDGRPGHPTITTLSELSSVLGELYEYSPLQPQDPSLPCETASEKPDGGLTTDSIAPSAKGTGKATEPGRSRDSGSGRQRAKGRSPEKEKI